MKNTTASQYSKFTDMSRRSLIGIVSVGIITGLLTFILGKVLDNYIIGPALCRDISDGACLNSASISFHVASVLSAILAVVMLINASVYRPLLIAAAVTIGTWHLHSIFLALPWMWCVSILVVIHTLSYLAFSWILRLYNFAIALILTILLLALVILISYI